MAEPKTAIVMLVNKRVLWTKDILHELWVRDPQRAHGLEVASDDRIVSTFEALIFRPAHGLWKLDLSHPLMDAANDVGPMPCVTVLTQIDTVSKEEALASWKEHSSLLFVKVEPRHSSEVEHKQCHEVNDKASDHNFQNQEQEWKKRLHIKHLRCLVWSI